MIDKKKFVELLNETGIPCSEALTKNEDNNSLPRIVFWEYMWEDLSASDETFDTLVTYQVSLMSDRPRDPSLMKLRSVLKENGINPVINHEFVQNEQEFHSFFAVEVTENLNE